MTKKKINIPLIGAIIIILFSIFTIFRVLYKYAYDYNLIGLNSIKEQITINAILNNKTDKTYIACYENSCTGFSKDTFLNVLTSNSNYADNVKKIRKIQLGYITDEKQPFKEISLYVGNKHYLYSSKDIEQFKRGSVKIDFDFSDDKKTYKTIVLPEINNVKPVLEVFTILVLSLFYNWQVFIIPYIWIIIGLIILFKNLKINKKYNLYKPILITTFLFGIIFRLAQFNDYPLYINEIHTKIISTKSLLSCFQSIENPPLFYLLEYIASKFSNQNNIDIILKVIPFIFGILFPYITYRLFKIFDKKTALLGAFLASFSLINIYYSNDINNYSMCMFLCVLGAYLTTKYVRKPNAKNLIYYTIYGLVAINTDFIFILFILSNLFWIIASLSDNKNEDMDTYQKTIRFFIISNIIIFINALPYLIKGIFNEKVMSESLNLNTFIYIMETYFRHNLLFIALAIITLIFIAIFFAPDKFREKINKFIKIKPKKEEFFIYSIYTIVFITITISIISISYKPILDWKILFDIWGFLFLAEIILISIFSDIKPKLAGRILSFVLILVLFTISNPVVQKDIFRIGHFLNFVAEDSQKYNKDYDIYVIIQDEKLIENYPEIKDIDYIKWHFTKDNYLDEIKKSTFVKNEQNAVIYCSDISCNLDKMSFLNQNLYIYKTNSNKNAKLIFKEKI